MIWTVVNIVLNLITFQLNTLLLLLLLLALNLYLVYKLAAVVMVVAKGTPESRDMLLRALSPLAGGDSSASQPPARPPPPAYRA